MAYEKQTWNNGDIITADKLNHIEDGIENNNLNVMVVILTQDGQDTSSVTCNKSAKEIYDALNNGEIIRAYYNVNDTYQHFPIIELSINTWDYNEGTYMIFMENSYSIVDNNQNYYSVYQTAFNIKNISDGQGDDTIEVYNFSYQIPKRTGS